MDEYLFSERELDRLRVKWVMYGYNHCLLNNSRDLRLNRLMIEDKMLEFENQANVIIESNKLQKELCNEN